ncbi:MAG: histidine phosphatase family protein [Acidimicrobiia bacterium]
MELVLIRHALPVRRELEGGAADPELSDVGHLQASLVAAHLGEEAIDALYVSPLRRARETAAPIAETIGLDAVVVDGVAEFDRNASFYIPLEEAMADPTLDWRKMWGADDDHSDFRAVVVDAIEGLIERHAGHRIAVVCHGGVINMYLGHVLGTPARMDIFTPFYTSINRVMASRRGHRQVHSVNEVSHLRGTELLNWSPLK